MSISISNMEFTDNKIEVNLSAKETGWTVSHYAQFEDGNEKLITSSTVVRIFHQEKEAFLTTDQITRSKLCGQVFFKQKSRKQKRITSPKSSNTLWIIELRDVAQGGIVTYSNQIRLKHMGSEKYLAVNEQNELHLVKDLDEIETIWAIHPVDNVIPKKKKKFFDSIRLLITFLFSFCFRKTNLTESNWENISDCNMFILKRGCIPQICSNNPKKTQPTNWNSPLPYRQTVKTTMQSCHPLAKRQFFSPVKCIPNFISRMRSCFGRSKKRKSMISTTPNP